MEHLMVDIETLSNKSYAVIFSIAAVEFDIDTGKSGRKFHASIDIQSSIDKNFQINASTLKWWMKQNDNARKQIYENNDYAYHIEDALSLFEQFCQTINKEEGLDKVKLWGNSNKFDLGLLEDAFNLIGREIPWNFRNERDVRTLVSFNPKIKENMIFEGEPHNPIDDCMHQIKYCSQIWNSF